MTVSEVLGFGGAALSGYAYLPQITHLIKERCSAGLSERAFTLWMIASILMTFHAVAIGALVFVLLGCLQIAATAVIAYYGHRYRGLVCPSHAPRADRGEVVERQGPAGLLVGGDGDRPSGRHGARRAVVRARWGPLRPGLRHPQVALAVHQTVLMSTKFEADARRCIRFARGVLWTRSARLVMGRWTPTRSPRWFATLGARP